jgi:metallo-beta-lactamase family protein
MAEINSRFVIHFLGAAETVTGSRYLLESDRSRVLVDCGLFQGYKKLRQRNWAPPGFEPAGVQAVILTHAHLDHTGYLPRLVNGGFAGPVYCTRGTRDLLRVLLPDAGHLQEEEARLASRYGFSHHPDPLPLFTREDALHCLERLRVIDYGATFQVTDEVRGSFTRAGHIVGSASLRLELGGTSIVFSGDVGRPHDPIMSPPDPLPAADYLVVESTYGDRRHPEQAPAAELGRIVQETSARGGTLVIPAFCLRNCEQIHQHNARNPTYEKHP